MDPLSALLADDDDSAGSSLFSDLPSTAPSSTQRGSLFDDSDSLFGTSSPRPPPAPPNDPKPTIAKLKPDAPEPVLKAFDASKLKVKESKVVKKVDPEDKLKMVTDIDRAKHNTGLGLGADLGSVFDAPVVGDDDDDLFGSVKVAADDNTMFDEDMVLKEILESERMAGDTSNLMAKHVGKNELVLGNDDDKLDDLMVGKMMTVGDDELDSMFDKSKVKQLAQGGDTANAVAGGLTEIGAGGEDEEIGRVEDGLGGLIESMKLADEKRAEKADAAINAGNASKLSFLDDDADEGGGEMDGGFDFASYIQSEGDGGGGDGGLFG